MPSESRPPRSDRLRAKRRALAAGKPREPDGSSTERWAIAQSAVSGHRRPGARPAVIGVLIVDDHPALRAGLTGLLEADGDVRVVAAARGGEEGVALAREHRPDVVLIDLEMPDLDGATATRRIVAENPSARIVVLTSFGDRPRILEALEAGAVGYLLKDTEPDELLRAVRAAAAGDAPLDPRAARELLAARRDREAIVELTERERQILTLVAGGHANKVIALRLGISHKTVRNTLSAACRKIGVTDRTQAALWAQRAGL